MDPDGQSRWLAGGGRRPNAPHGARVEPDHPAALPHGQHPRPAAGSGAQSPARSRLALPSLPGSRAVRRGGPGLAKGDFLPGSSYGNLLPSGYRNGRVHHPSPSSPSSSHAPGERPQLRRNYRRYRCRLEPASGLPKACPLGFTRHPVSAPGNGSSAPGILSQGGRGSRPRSRRPRARASLCTLQARSAQGTPDPIVRVPGFGPEESR